MKLRYLLLSLALFQMTSLFGANASANAAADVKTSAAHAAAKPIETDIKKGHSVAFGNGMKFHCSQTLSMSPEEIEACQKLFALQGVCEHLNTQIVDAIATQLPHLKPKHWPDWIISVERPVLSHSMQALDPIHESIKQSPNYDRNCSQLIQQYAATGIVDCHIKITNPMVGNGTDYYLGTYNTDTNTIVTDGVEVSYALDNCDWSFKNLCGGAHSNAPFIHCLKKIMGGQPCEHVVTAIKSEFLKTVSDHNDAHRYEVIQARLGPEYISPAYSGSGQNGEIVVHIRDHNESETHVCRYDGLQRKMIAIVVENTPK